MRNMLRIFKLTKKLWRYYAVIAVLTIVLSLLSQLQPIFTKAVVDQITKAVGGTHADVALVALFAVLIFVTDLGQTLLSNISGYLGDMMSARLQQLMSERYYEHILGLSQRYFDTELSGKLINRMNRGISQISSFMQMFSNNFLQFIFSTIFSLIIVLYYSWQVGVMLLLLYPIFIFLTGKTSGKWQQWQQEINTEQDIASGRFAEAVGQVRVVKSFLQEQRELRFWRQAYERVVRITRPQSVYWHRQDVGRRLVLNLIFLAVFVFIFVETARGRYSIGTMVLLIQYAALIRVPIFSISFLVDSTQRAIANTKDYFEVMDARADVHDAPEAATLQIPNGEIVFEHVAFAYDEGKPVLKGVDFRVAPESKVALVGESGEGKTTITNLLLRLYDVSGGRIMIDGQEIRKITQASLRAAIGVVFQDPALFSGTVRENIAYARPHATDDAVTAAAKAANAHEFITGFEKGYDTEIGERGLKLSGGQKQRIAIARALLKDAPILILDEATSSLDSKSEHLVQQALQRLMKGRTTLIIAHRLSTIQSVDQIITLRGGVVDEAGTPEQLAASGGIYAQLLKLQQGATEAGKKKLREYEIAG